MKRIVVILVLLLGMAGCGVKTFPVPPRRLPPPPAANLSAEVSGGTLTLSWQIQKAEDGKNAAAGFRVYRSKEPVSEPDCKTCPVTYEQVADLAVSDTDREKGRMIHTESLEKGYRYKYKVTVYGVGEIVGQDSESVNIVY
ncbi:hypothetical protein [Desulfonema ishimotonii]|uniref:hypothetical protein n=1 Tax=Desulfonema ishimotonii TaxID=45657 RepID=UPI000F56D4A7|nr:hypothetical protein [Desulfonema ishimotonii]